MAKRSSPSHHARNGGQNKPHRDGCLLWRRLSARRPPATLLPGVLHHSDRGSTDASQDYRAALKSRAMVASMSRKADCWDNAVAESFFGTIKGELVDHQVYETRAAAVASIGEYIDVFYNHERRHSSIGYVSPVEFELRRGAKRDLDLNSREEAA